MITSISNSNRLAVIAITQDQAKIWRRGIGPEDLPEFVSPPKEVDHRHRRTGQYQHSHDTAHRFPEFFEDIAELIREDSAILIIGHGKGKGAYHHLLQDYLSRKHPDISKKVLGFIDLDLSAMSDGQIAMHARQWFEKNFRKLATWHDRQSPPWF